MEQKVVPTSPKRRKNEKPGKGNSPHPRTYFVVVVIALVLGATAGLLGFTIASSVPSSWPVIGKLNVVNSFEQERQNVLLATRSKGSSVITQSPQVVDVIATMYSEPPTLTAPATFLADAVVLTADGWLVTTVSALPELTDDTAVTVVLPDGSVRAITETRTDDFSGLVFIKVDAQNLTVANLSSAVTLRAGETVSILEKQMQEYVVYERRVAGGAAIGNSVRSTGDFQQQALLDSATEINRSGLPVLYSNGELVGITKENGEVVHSSAIVGLLPAIVSSGEIARSARTIEYIQLAQVTDAEKQRLGLPDNGIYITAAEVGSTDLQEGDVVTSINNQFVGADTDFSSLMHARAVGTTFFMTVVRDGKEQTIEFKS